MNDRQERTKNARSGLGVTLRSRTSSFACVSLVIFCALVHASDVKSVAKPGQSSTLLPDGRSLLVGGADPNSKPSALAYLLDRSGQVISLPSLQVARAGHTASLLPDGTVFIFGGIGGDGQIVQVAELFNPATEQFTVLTDVIAVPRANHTATVLTDGSLLLAGGIEAGGQFPEDVQFWDFRSGHAVSLESPMFVPREGHSARLLADGTVRIAGGEDRNGHSVSIDEIYDPVTKQFHIANQEDSGSADNSDQRIAASIPEDGTQNVPIDQIISFRFSHLLNVAAVGTANFILLGPNESTVAVNVTPVENGRLVFVIPQAALQSGTLYTLRVTQVVGANGEPLPDTSISFQTAGEPAETSIGSDGQFPPVTTTQWQQLRPLQAPPNQTAVAGQVLKLTGWPLKDVTLEIEGGPKAHSDSTGRFLLQGVTPGHHVLWIDGATANHDQVSYGVYEVGVTVLANKTNVLNYTIWMTPLDTAHTVRILSPTTTETVITNPNLPGLELHLPASTVITDRYGKTVREVSITAIPLDRPPFPLPTGVLVPVYLTVQPGGAWVKVLNPGTGPRGARLVYPNTWNYRPGTPFDFWNYDADVKGWYIYGEGHVTLNGLSIAPDPGVVIYGFTGAMDGSPSGAPNQGPPDGPQSTGGDPVDLSTGQFTYKNTDLTISDTIPISFTRTYIANDSRSRAFGIGSMHNYDIFTVGDTFPYTYQELILPNGTRVRFDRISPGTSYLDVIYVATTSAGAFYGARMSWDQSAGNWKLVMKNGTVLRFPEAFQVTNPFCQALLSITDRYGNSVNLTRTGSNCNLTKITSPNGRYINLTNDSQGRITLIQDNMGRSVSYAYDAAGRLSNVTDANGGVTNYTYDDQNRMLTIQDPRGTVYLSNQYDSSGRVTQQTQGDNSTYLFNWTPANSAQTHFYPNGGNGAALVENGCWSSNGFDRYQDSCQEGYLPLVAQVNVTDPRGYQRQVVFGPTGYATSDTHALGQPEQRTVTYSYYADNRIQSITDPLGRVTSTNYDANGNRTRVTRLDSTPNAITTSLTYEPQFNHLTGVTDPLGHTASFSYEQNGSLAGVTDALNHSTTFSSNSLGQITSATDALNDQAQFTYFGGDLSSATDPIGNLTTQFTDAVGRVTSATDAQGNSVKLQYDQRGHLLLLKDGQGNQTSFAYDPNGNLLSVTDPLSHTTSWTYDNMDRILTRKDALNRQSIFSYDSNGNLASATDRKGQLTIFGYDALNRRTFVGFNAVVNGGNTTYDSTISFSYDADNNPVQVIDSAGGTISRVYDGLNRLTTENTDQGSVSYQYDSAGRRTSMTVAGQPAINYSYDNANRLAQVTKGSGTVAFAYDNANRRSSLTLPNGVTVAYTYDGNSRIAQIVYQFAGNILGNLTYTYDERGLRTQVGGSFARTNLPSAVISASYDASNELTNWNGLALNYDANGNMLSDGSNAFTWNARNQVAAVNGTLIQYDALGRRTQNLAGTSFLYDGSNATQELSGSTVTANLLTGGIDELFTRADASGNFTPLQDALGSTIALVDAGGNVQKTYSYDPFGNTSSAGESSSNPRQYAGRENEGNGLYYYRARYYSPALSRFVSEDPRGFQAGINFYAYVNDNPINFSDPFGLDKTGGGYGADCGDPQTACDSHGNCLFGECMPWPATPTPSSPSCEEQLSAAECEWMEGQMQTEPWENTDVPTLPNDPPPVPPPGTTDNPCNDVAYHQVSLGLDTFGAIPLAGNYAKGAQLATGIAGTGYALYKGDSQGVGMGAVGLGLGAADNFVTLTVKGVEVIPVLGNVVSGISAGIDLANVIADTMSCGSN